MSGTSKKKRNYISRAFINFKYGSAHKKRAGKQKKTFTKWIQMIFCLYSIHNFVVVLSCLVSRFALITYTWSLFFLLLINIIRVLLGSMYFMRRTSNWYYCSRSFGIYRVFFFVLSVYQTSSYTIRIWLCCIITQLIHAQCKTLKL